MGKQYKQMTQNDMDFIKTQKLFYIASSSGKEVNLSPKGYDFIKIKDESTLIFANLPGSGNRTYRDAVNDGEFTLVFNAFSGDARILRIFCKAIVIDKEHNLYKDYLSLFDIKASVIRDIFELNIYAVESSCGTSVPFYDYVGDRDDLKDWAIDMDEKDKLEAYKEKRFTPPDLKNLDK